MLSVSQAQLEAWVIAFMLPMTRILALITSAPFWSNRGISVRIRLAAGLVVGMAVLPALPDIRPFPADSWFALGALAQEFLIGLAIGFAMRIFFAAVDLAGEMVGLQMGLSFAVFFNPQTGGQSSAIASLLTLMCTVVFIVLNGHLLLVEIVVRSFEWLPVAHLINPEGFALISRSVVSIFALGVLLTLPMVVTLMVTNIALGVLTRAAPQLNIFAVGFPVTISIGYLVLGYGLTSFAPLLEQIFHYGFESIDLMLKTLATIPEMP
ncbi:MAG: flagellar biosynthetic protein FliR [Rhodocyclaceae bacterium]|nr:flagellar biosynthetic protein FliR [Rhodocyclaceae bacterium]